MASEESTNATDGAETPKGSKSAASSSQLAYPATLMWLGQDAPAQRAQDERRGSGSSDWAADVSAFAVEEDQVTLLSRAQCQHSAATPGLFGQVKAPSPDYQQEAEGDDYDDDVLGSLEIPTVGSKNHELGLCKPCAFVFKNGCTSGVNCAFCHLCGPGEKRRRRKEFRAFRRTKGDGRPAADSADENTPGAVDPLNWVPTGWAWDGSVELPGRVY